MFKKLKQKFVKENNPDNFLNNVPIDSVNTMDYYQLKNINDLGNNPYKLVMENMVNKEVFVEKLNNFRVVYANTYNRMQFNRMVYFGFFIEKIMHEDVNNYVFHNVKSDPMFSTAMTELITIPDFLPAKNMDDLRICRLYAGAKYSGTNLHAHSAALNYMISGKKLWILFPNNETTRAFVEKHKMKFGEVEEYTLDWFQRNYDNLMKHKNELYLQIAIQNAKEVMYVPPSYYHAVINLDDVIGITYSWN